MKPGFKITEGARTADGMYVLTEAELHRALTRYASSIYDELARLRAALAYQNERQTFEAKTFKAFQARRETYRNSTKKRYARYKALLEQHGETRQDPWYRHLAELEKKAAA